MICSGKKVKTPAQRKRASSLVVAMVFVTVCALTVGSVLIASTRQTRNTYRSRLFNTSLAAAATAVNSMSQQAYFIATTRPGQLQGNFANLNDAILAIKPKKNTGYVSMKKGQKDLSFLKAVGSNDGEYEVINDPHDDWNGFNIQRWRYQIVSFMNEGNEATGALDANAQRLGFQGAGFSAALEINFIPLYQYAIFYDNDLELHNGPVMDVKGPVHSNRTLWIATQSGLNFHDRVSAAGGFRNYNDFRKAESGSLVAKVNAANAYLEDGAAHDGEVTIKKLNGTMQGMRLAANDTKDTNKNRMLDSNDRNWLTDAMARYDGRLQDSSMGIKPIKPPLPYVENQNGDRVQAEAGELIQRAKASDNDSMKQAKMEYQADLIIEGNALTSTWNNTTKEYTNITIKDRQGNTYPNTVYNSKTKKYESIVTPASFYDNREQKTVNSFDVNMAQINSRAASLPVYSGNGLLYISPTGGSLPSVRLTEGATMPSNFRNTMTVATDKPMYLAGNVNSSAKKVLLLAADAITVISQGQDLTKFTQNNKPVAAGNTITNAIFMLGQVASKYDNNTNTYTDPAKRKTMSGGAHNVLRYLENWDGKSHEFNGSLICLFESRLATSEFWRKVGNNKLDFYNPPNRKYNWDAALRTSEPPAGMPVLVQVITGVMNRLSIDQAIEKAG